MIHFASPYLLLLLLALPVFALPIFARRAQVRSKPGFAFSSVLSSEELRAAFKSIRIRIRSFALRALLALAYTAFVIALARPQFGSSYQETQWSGRDLLLALDISGSMQALDFAIDGKRVDRLTALKYVMARFINARRGDRIGLVVFGDQVFTQCPLTLDHRTVISFLNELAVGMAGQGTAIGDALAISLKRLRDISAESKAIVLVTDGKNNSGNVDPIEMARLAKELKTRVYVVGIGGTESAPFPMETAFGFTSIIQRPMEYDEEALKRIAEITDGYYFNAKNIERLQDVYTEIDRLEARASNVFERVDYEELYLPFLLFGMLSITLFLVSRSTFFLKVTT